ncbi:uncharacterized protein F5Z01DRAFT_253947 [Emericellopsis atlantica]|uniref:Rhodopsin domain-containing protein n=1 Tax=Emericellopsis atlantica TaxID=2614577 RepID=A0A9P8CM94_9HYPO|nr:uncharacterized protein F5Z01DRAFT_253947 [Emericellopsis atlantica]KAG9251862.1 hypothetical protein F5Z01DRAFT_253947 [Emericellopsis atlantica]
MGIPNRGPELQAVCYTLVTAAIVATVLRCYTRVYLVKSFGFDDWCMIFALATFILFVTCALVGVEHGTGRHRVDLADEDIKTAMKYWWFCYIWYCLTMIASKISIGYFLLRITIRRTDVWIIYGVMVITVLTGMVFFFVTMFQCTPIAYFWNKDQSGSCVSMDVIIALTYLYSACSVICDFTFAILPMVIIWTLNINKRSKLALVPIMAMACVASAAVVVRFPYVMKFKDPDFLWATVDIAIWSCTEQGLAITAGSLATLRPLLRNVGYCFGLSTPGPTELRDSSGRLPSGTIGGQASRKSKGMRTDPFSLTAIERGDSNDNNSSDENMERGVFGSRHQDGRIAPWEAQGRSHHGSEEGLAHDTAPAWDADWRHKNIVQVQSVTVSSSRAS